MPHMGWNNLHLRKESDVQALRRVLLLIVPFKELSSSATKAFVALFEREKVGADISRYLDGFYYSYKSSPGIRSHASINRSSLMQNAATGAFAADPKISAVSNPVITSPCDIQTDFLLFPFRHSNSIEPLNVSSVLPNSPLPPRSTTPPALCALDSFFQCF